MTLTQLLLQGNPIDQESEQRLVSFISRNKALQQLFEAFRRGNLGDARRLFSTAPPEIHTRVCNQESLLQAACKSGNSKVVVFLLKELLVKSKTFPLLRGNTAEMLGANEADLLIESFKMLHQSNPLWCIRTDDNETLLHWFAASSAVMPDDKAVALVAALVGCGCNPNTHAWSTGVTPLLCCQTSAVVVEMLRLGADAGACDLRGCGVESHLSTECLDAVKRNNTTPTMKDIIVGVYGGAGSRALPGTLHSTADQIIQAALSPVSQQEAELHRGPWWVTAEAAPRNLPLGCFPLLTVKDKRIRLCDLDRLSETVIDRPDMLVICAYATDGPEVNTTESWARQQQTLRKWLAKAPKSTAVLAGMDSRTDPAVIRLLRQHKMAHVPLVDALYQARRMAFHGYGEFQLSSLRSNLIRFLELCVAFHDARLAGAEIKEDTFHARGAFVRPLMPLPEAVDARNFVKVIVLGPSSVGKSSVLEKITHRKSLLSRRAGSGGPSGGNGSQSPNPTGDSTIGIDEVSFDVGKDITTTVYDFSGSLEYLCVNEMFLSRHDTLYMIIVDASDESSPQKLAQWLQFLNDHPRGPADSCRLLLVCNKADRISVHATKDKKSVGGALLKQKEDQMISILRELPMLAKLPVDVVSMSSKTGDNVDKLRELCRAHVLAIAGSPVPRLFRHASDAVCTLSRVAPETFFTAIDFKKSLPPDLLAELHDRDFRLWNDVLEHLHCSGQIVCDLDNFSFVCLRPAIMAKAFGLFFAPSSHLELMTGTRNGARADTIGFQEACTRISCLPGLDSPQEKEFVMHLLEQKRFCYSPHAASRTVVFPCLRPACDSLATVLRSVHAHKTKLVRMTCLVWECTSCKTRGKGRLLAECPNCGAHHTLKQSCSSNCSHCTTARGQHEALPEVLRLVDSSHDPAVCTGVLPTTQRPARIQMSRACMCGEKLRRDLKTLAERIIVQSDHVTTPLTLFSGLVSAMSNMLAPEFQLYNNATAFYDVLGNTTAVFMSPHCPSTQPLEMANGEIQLLLLVRGVAPELWVDTLPELAGIGQRELLCPICATLHDQHFVALYPDSQQLRCPNGHVLPASGMLTDPSASSFSPSTTSPVVPVSDS